MPIIQIQVTAEEVLTSAIKEARVIRDELFALADLEKRPLEPGESVPDRHHKIAKLGKRLAMAFTAFDNTMQMVAEATTAPTTDHHQPKPEDKPEAN
jgi:hypothetical protein